MKKSKYYFDKKAADHAVGFIENTCTHVKGEMAGKPYILEDWEKDEIVRPLFGWKKQDGTRRYRYAWIEVPRKNSKTTLGATLALYLLAGDGEPGAEVYSAAAAKEQARICFDIASSMVKQNEILTEALEAFRNTILMRNSSSFYRVISSEAYSKHGFNAHGIVFDEIHAQPDRELWDVLTTSIGSRRQPMVVCITTAGIINNEHIAWKLHKRAKDIKNGLIKDDQFLSVIYQAGSEDDPFAENTWKKCNPNYGKSVKPEYIKAKAEEAKSDPGVLNTFKRLHLNVWTSSLKQFITNDAWQACNLEPLNLDFFAGKRVALAFDLSATKDFTALSIGTKDDDGISHIFTWTFIPEVRLSRRSLREQIEGWSHDGWVEIVAGVSLEYEFVYDRINKIREMCDVFQIGFDGWNKNWLVNKLASDGAPLKEIRQGYKTLSPATKDFEKAIMSKKINHGGNPVMSWMNGNVAIEEDPAGNIKPTKGKSVEKIDGIIAMIMCHLLLMEIEDDDSNSVYDTRGVLVI